MSRLVPALALSTAAFAGSTVYFAHQLSLERERRAESAPVVTTPTPTSEAHAAPVRAGAPVPAHAAESTANKGLSPWVAATSASDQVMSEADMKKMQAEYSRSFLAQLADPERREEMLAEHKMMMRNTYPRVAQVLGLSPEEYSSFLELSAQQLIDMQEAGAKCVLDADCQMGNSFPNGNDSRKQELDQLLGPDRSRKLEVYKNTMGEREAVAQLRGRLPDTMRLSDDRAEGLITALAEERDLIHREAAQRGDGLSSFNIGAGMVFAPADGATFEERYESARQSSQRLHDRAAQYLNAEQLRAFDEMQDETLLGLRRMLRNKDGMSMTTVGVIGPAD
ncbi:MAG TPA: hypothetical protein VM146_00405 [Steroidobacteraceae bacterium]|nr:hypothetical protein [Steroidobacteraceae bacterium]